MPARESDRVTPPRAAMTQSIATVYRAMLAGEDRLELVHDLLVESLEPRLRQLYDTFEAMHAQGYTSMMSSDVADLLNVKQNDASGMLKLL